MAPRFIETDMTKDLPRDHVLPGIPAGRVRVLDGVAGAVEFLRSDAASYVVGQVLSFNGGVYL